MTTPATINHSMHATHSIETPINAVGAVSIIRICGQDLDAVCASLSMDPLPIGQIRLSKILNLDDALLARFDATTLLVMPHGGIAITRAISRAFSEAGIPLAQTHNPVEEYPEAADFHEARMLRMLSRAPSPLAVDLLLDQPRRWREAPDPDQLADARVLNRLLSPPIVVAVGRANIGKSSLANALAGDSVAMVSDHAGTTRDHLGVMLNLAGLAVRWVDTPGIDERVEVGEELTLLTPIIRSADLIIHAIDHDDPDPSLDPRLREHLDPATPILQTTVRADLSTIRPSLPLPCSAKTGQGIQELTTAIRDQLIPPEHLTDPRPWRFWES